MRAALTFALLVTCALGAHASTRDDGARPNILFIVADDQSPFDLRAYRPSSRLETPTIDRLAAEGMVLDAAYHMGSWSGAVCTPSRHMIMSGRSVWHLPKRGVAGEGANPECPEDLADHTLAAVFNAAGYATMRTCKLGNSYEAANAQFSVRRDATKRGASSDSGSAWHADQVLDYLDTRERDADERPFLIYFGFSHPHDPRMAPEALLERYGASNDGPSDVIPAEAPPLPPNYLPEHPFHHGHPHLRDEVAVQGVLERRDEATIRNEIGRQFACSENIDMQIARVLEKLEALGELDNTYVVYTSDHGMAIGRHGLQGKQNLYEHTWRVPLIVRGPGIAAGSRAPGNVYLLDCLATLCDLTGLAPPASNEGHSFRGVLEGRDRTVREVLFGVYAGGTKPGMRSVRKGDWKLIKYDVLDGAVRQTQLFELASNPWELIDDNLAEDERHRAKRLELEALLLAEMERLDDPYRLWDQPER